MKPEVSIIVPAYNEAESLPELAGQVRAAMEAAGRTFEVWLIDDGSDDGTWKVIENLAAGDNRIQGLRFRQNYGKSAALSVGFERARGDYIATLDADLQDDPAGLPAMIDKLEAGADLVSGWKRKRRDPISKTIPSRFFNTVTRLASGIPLHDFNCGLKAYRAEVVKSVHVYGELHRYIPMLAMWAGFTRIEEQEVQHRAVRAFVGEHLPGPVHERPGEMRLCRHHLGGDFVEAAQEALAVRFRRAGLDHLQQL